MRDSMALGAAVENRLGWIPIPSSPSDSRQEFDSLCSEWARFQMDPSGYRQAPPALFAGNESTATLSLSGTSEEDRSFWDGTDSSGSHPQSTESHPHSSTSHHQPSPRIPHPSGPKDKSYSAVVTETTVRSSSSQDHSRSSQGQNPMTLLDLPDEVIRHAPSERQCRTFRVMVAWKA